MTRQHRPARPVKTWTGTTVVPSGHEALTSDGRRKSQCTGAIRGHSKVEAAKAMRMSIGEFNNYWNEVTASWVQWDAVNPLLANNAFYRLHIAPLDPGDTIDGQESWVQA